MRRQHLKRQSRVWGSRMFRFENCDECGKGARGHDVVWFFAGWFALCKTEAQLKSLHCDMGASCVAVVTHIDEKGFVYCQPHGVSRRGGSYGVRCRKLTPVELRTLQAGGTISYRRGK